MSALEEAAATWAGARRALLSAQSAFEVTRRAVPAGQTHEDDPTVAEACTRLREARAALAAAEASLLLCAPA